MPLRRDHRFAEPTSSPLLTRGPLAGLRELFGNALRCALASTVATVALGACSQSHGGPADGPADAVTPASAGRSADPGAAGSAGSIGKPADPGVAGSAGSAGTPSVHPTQLPRAGAGGGGGASEQPRDAGMTPVQDAATPPGPVASGPTCQGQVWQRLADLKASEGYDYASLRMRYNMAPTYTELASTGTACEGAQDRAECNRALDATIDRLPAGTVCGMIGDCLRYLVTTAGDEVSLYATRAELLEFLGLLDTPQDVLLLLEHDRYTVTCQGQASVTGAADASQVTRVADGFVATVLKEVSDCPFQYARVQLMVTPAGVVTEISRELLPQTGGCAGRRPEGLCSSHVARTRSALGEYFAAMAHLEAASVPAFETLAGELALHGAPRALIAAATAAAADEVRHTELTARLARRFGATPTPARVEALAPRALFALALDNAVEGCVRETYGALLGSYQAQAARDPEVAALMRVIAEDETRHAALAYELAAWLEPQLADSERAQVDAARAQAVSELAAELARPQARELCELAGVPSASVALQLHAALQQQLWAAPASA